MSEGNEAEMTVSEETQARDELTVRQQTAIEQEISLNIGLVGQKEPLTVLLKEYAIDDIYQSKLGEISKSYGYIRRTRPDGNCFFRAYCYSVFEGLIQRPDTGPAFRTKVIDAKQLLIDAGLTQFTVEDFYDNFLDMVDRVLDGMSEETLYSHFQDAGVADYLVVFLRILTSAELRKNSEFYTNFIEGGLSVEEFCQLEVEPMYKESDHIHIIALTTAFGVGVRVVYVDRGVGAKHDFPDGCSPKIHLLYRPGHYDIIYPGEANPAVSSSSADADATVSSSDKDMDAADTSSDNKDKDKDKGEAQTPSSSS